MLEEVHPEGMEVMIFPRDTTIKPLKLEGILEFFYYLNPYL